jgi:hypothetical protein
LLFVLQTNGDAVVDPGPDLGTSYKTNQVWNINKQQVSHGWN